MAREGTLHCVYVTVSVNVWVCIEGCSFLNTLRHTHAHKVQTYMHKCPFHSSRWSLCDFCCLPWILLLLQVQTLTKWGNSASHLPDITKNLIGLMTDLLSSSLMSIFTVAFVFSIVFDSRKSVLTAVCVAFPAAVTCICWDCFYNASLWMKQRFSYLQSCMNFILDLFPFLTLSLLCNLNFRGIPFSWIMFLHLCWSKPAVNSVGWTWFRKTHGCL